MKIFPSDNKPRLEIGGLMQRPSIKALATSLIITLVATAFSPAITGCSGGPGSTNPNLSASQKGTIYYINDNLGSAQIVADAETGTIYEEVIYPYGLSAESNTDISGEDIGEGADYSYTTKERDAETGLIYFGKRYYSPDMGRWLTPDPLFVEDSKAVSNSPHEGNLYAYVKGNPVSFIDSDGDFAIGPVIGVAIMAAWYILSDPNVANAPAPGEPLIANPTPRERAESYAIDAVAGYLGYRAFKYAFAYARGAEKAAFRIGPSVARNAEQSISVYHGSITDYKWIRSAGLNPHKTAYVSRSWNTAMDVFDVGRDAYVRSGGEFAGVIESRIPKSTFDKFLAGSERPYRTKLGIPVDSTEIFLDTAEMIETFNKYIVKN